MLSAALVGLAFETKMLQAFVILPAFIGVYLLAGSPKLGKRLWQLVVAAITVVVSAGWWVGSSHRSPAAAQEAPPAVEAG